MLIGYVSDERYVAVPDVQVEFEREGAQGDSVVVRSTPRGAVYADLSPGAYRITLAKEGYGAKTVAAQVEPGKPLMFRLLSDRLLGYIYPKWTQAGGSGEFRVHSVEPYRLSLYRYGWKKEFVRLLGWFDEHGPRAVMQVTPDEDYTQTGVAWNRIGYVSSHHGQRVIAPERSGLYTFHAETRSGAFFTFPWVVAPSAPQAKIAVLAATNTWNAYNNFGGRSNYIHSTGLPLHPTVNARLELRRYTGNFVEWEPPDEEYKPLSFDRPEPGNSIPRDTEATDPIIGREGCHLAPAEWRALAWLEREGFAYDLYSDYQLHSGQLDLDAYRVLIIGVHPEYWSETMYRRVKTWVDERGGRLLYLGGNGLNCCVEFLDEGTMRCRSHLMARDGKLGMADPNNPERYLESRFDRAVESEACLLGVVTTETGIMTAAPYRVTDASHWIYAGTGLQNGDLFGMESLHERCHGGASGHETDKMSPHSPPGTRLLAKGLNPNEGGAEIVCYETASGGAVYSVGSITYAASLLVDEAASRITRNVLERFTA
jgi:N,N-dimethylformamidase